jgi:hypothetical protein
LVEEAIYLPLEIEYIVERVPTGQTKHGVNLLAENLHGVIYVMPVNLSSILSVKQSYICLEMMS